MLAKWCIVLSFLFAVIIYKVETVQPTTLYDDSDTQTEPAEILDKIQPGNALPLVLYLDHYNKPQLPIKIEKAVIIDGRMRNRTKFSSQIHYLLEKYFCANKNSKENCIISKKFRKDDALLCEAEAIPNVQFANSGCVANGQAGRLYQSFYKICDDEKYKFDVKKIPFYNICYDENRKKSLYSKHVMRSIRLLNSKLLIREREVNYEIRNDLKLANEETHSNTQDKQGSPSQNDATTKSAYKPQKLVPAEDMALALWRKTTFEQANIALQHEKFLDFWNEICEHIRYEALLNNNHGEPIIYTGVFDTNLTPKNTADQQIYNMWVKLVYYYDSEPSRLTSPKLSHGIAVLMNNFIETGTDNEAGSNSQIPTLETYCDKNLCVDFLKNKFQQAGGKICCSSITEKILQLFGLDGGAELQVSSILDITKDQETFKDDDISYQHAAYSIRQIKRNEVLPIIFVTMIHSPTNLNVPLGFIFIKTKNRRISSSSQFIASYNSEQIFFCPKLKSDEKCLEPIEFDESRELQCIEEATPLVRNLPDGENKCGMNGHGTLHKIFYEICPAEKTYEYKTRELQFYEFCYDADKQKILFTKHRIRSPLLLFSKLLLREHAIEYPMIETDLPLSNLEEFKKAENSFASQDSSNESPYKVQKLVPSEDMAFALWRKPTYNYINVELQHEKLIPLWNHINHRVRNYAQVWNDNENANVRNLKGISILNGVFDIDIKPMSNNNTKNEKSNMWVKIIYDNESAHYDKAIAILMSNFVAIKLNEDPLKEYCEENLCAETLLNKFLEVDGRISCCRVNGKIAELFGLQVSDINPNNGMLFIRDIIRLL